MDNKKLNLFWKQIFTVKTFDVAISGMFLAMFLILTTITKYTLAGALNIAIEIPFWIIFGIVLGPVKGSMLAIICDTLVQLLLSKTGLGTWMIEYAMIPPLVTIVSWLMFMLFQKNHFWTSIILSLILAFVIITNVTVLILRANNKHRIGSIKVSFDTMLIVTLFLSSLLLLVNLGFWIYLIIGKNHKAKIWRVLFVMTLIAFIIVLARWIWGPYAYVAYYNRFVAGTKPAQNISDRFVPLIIPIILKSSIEIPIYTILLTPITNALLQLKDKSYNNVTENKW